MFTDYERTLKEHSLLLERKKEEEILEVFQEIRDGMCELQSKGAVIDPIKNTMLEAKPLMEMKQYFHADIIKDKCLQLVKQFDDALNIHTEINFLSNTIESKPLNEALKENLLSILRLTKELLLEGNVDVATQLFEDLKSLYEDESSLEGVKNQQIGILQDIKTTADIYNFEIDSLDEKLKEMISSDHRDILKRAIFDEGGSIFQINDRLISEIKRADIDQLRSKISSMKEEGINISRCQTSLDYLEEHQDSLSNIFVTLFVDVIFLILKWKEEKYSDLIKSSINLGSKMEQLKENGIWDDLLLKIFGEGIDSMDNGDYDFAFISLDFIHPNIRKMVRLAEKQGIVLDKGEAEKLLISVNKSLSVLEKVHIDTNDFWQKLREAKEHFSNNNYERVIEILRPVKKNIQKRRHRFEDEMEEKYDILYEYVRGNLVLLKQDGINVNNQEDKLLLCQDYLDDSDMPNALICLHQVDSELSNLLDCWKDYQEIEDSCRERYGEIISDPDRISFIKKYNAMENSKTRGDIEEAIRIAKEFLEETDPDVFFENDEVTYDDSEEFSSEAGETDPLQYGIRADQAGSRYAHPQDFQYHTGYGSAPNVPPGYDQAGYSNPPSPYKCSLCGAYLRYINQYRAWWCDRCERYEGE